MSSASIEFPYSRRPRASRTILLPTIAADVQLPLGFHPIRPLVDSGADYTMLPRTIGRLIGLDFAHWPRLDVTGIGGQHIRGFKASVRLRVAKRLLPPIPCIYVDSDRAPLLLGREGFFDLFTITFDNRRKKVLLTPLF